MSADTSKELPPIETDARYPQRLENELPTTSEARRIRREFLCDVAARVATAAPGGLFAGRNCAEAWDIAEALCREGQRRGYLP